MRDGAAPAIGSGTENSPMGVARPGTRQSRLDVDAHFADKEDCFLADQPAYARVLFVDMPTAGPIAAGRLDAAGRRFADLNRKWHRQARTRHPEWPSVPGQAYQALSGASTELVRTVVRADQTATLPRLEETLMSLHMAVLADRPWTA